MAWAATTGRLVTFRSGRSGRGVAEANLTPHAFRHSHVMTRSDSERLAATAPRAVARGRATAHPFLVRRLKAAAARRRRVPSTHASELSVTRPGFLAK